MSDTPHGEPDPRPGVARTERMLPPQPVGATTWVPVLAVVALLIAICLYFFGGFSTSIQNMRALLLELPLQAKSFQATA